MQALALAGGLTTATDAAAHHPRVNGEKKESV